MASEKFDCSNCGGHGKIVYKDDSNKFPHEVVFCPFCGADLDLEVPDLEEEDYEE